MFVYWCAFPVYFIIYKQSTAMFDSGVASLPSWICVFGFRNDSVSDLCEGGFTSTRRRS